MSPDQDREELYIRAFLAFSERAEKVLLKTIAVLILLLVVFQGLLQFETVRNRLLDIERLEGERLDFATSAGRVLY
jgi:heme A synthase